MAAYATRTAIEAGASERAVEILQTCERRAAGPPDETTGKDPWNGCTVILPAGIAHAAWT
jgi:hypothetical protein